MTLDIIRHPALNGLPHGFFARGGGASSGIFAGLNCGPGSSDQAEAVAENRARVARALGLDPGRLVTLAQVHSAAVVTLEAPPLGRLQGDALVTRTPELGLGILTADCAPVLLHDPEAGVIGAAHAGWRGAIGGILGATVAAMTALGALPRRIRAAIGPTIGPEHFEVGPELQDAARAADPALDAHFRPGRGDRLMMDLPGLVAARLGAAGVGSVAWTGHCTYGDPARFYSYRRATHHGTADYGRLISVIALPAPHQPR